MPNWVDVRSFAPPGTPRDGSTAWDGPIQAAINSIFQSYSNSFSPETITLYLPPGKYLLTKPVNISITGEGQYGYCALQIAGDNGLELAPSELITDFSDKPAIIIQGGKGVKLKDLMITGKNNWVQGLTENQIDSILLSENDAGFLLTDINKGIAIQDDSQYAPYAGICIDPFCSLDHIPQGLGYPGMDSSYLPSGGSSLITIERCTIQQFVVGIMITPNPVTQNAEGIYINDCTIGTTKSAIAIGQGQSRYLSCTNLSANYTKYVIDCTHYGNGGGDCPSIFNAGITHVRFLFSTFSYGSGASINGLYCEATKSLGLLYGGGASDGYCFSGCGFNLMGQPSGPYTNYHLFNAARATFNSCQFSVGDLAGAVKTSLPLWIHSAGFLSFKDCILNSQPPDVGLPVWVNDYTQPDRLSFDNTFIGTPPEMAAFGGSILSRHLSVYVLERIANQYMLPGCFFFPMYVEPENPTAPVMPRWVAGGQRWITLGPASALNFAVNAATGAVTFNSIPGTVAPGDLIYSDAGYQNVLDPSPQYPVTGVIGKAASVDPATGLVTLQYVPAYVLAAGNNISSRTRLYIIGYYKVHASTQAQVLDSTTLTINPPQNPAVWLAGDRVRDSGNLIAPNTYVTSFDGSKLTLSRPMNNPQLNKFTNLYDADVRMFDIGTQAL